MVNKLKNRRDTGRKVGFAYKERSVDNVRKRAAQKGGMYDSPFQDGFDTWRAKPGDNTIRFLPPTWDGAEHFGFDVYVHRNVGSDNSTYLCLNKMKGKPCA